MEGEINNLVLVWCYIFMSSCYCYGTTKLLPKGTIRFFVFLPMPYLLSHLPPHFSSFSLSNPTALSITWLASFKILLLAFDTGPLSNPSLSLFQFFLIFALPIILQEPISPKSHPIKEKKPTNQEKDSKDGHRKPNSNTHKLGLKSLSFYAKNFILLVILIVLGNYKDKVPRDVVLFTMCIYIYVGLEVMLGMSAMIAQSLLGTKIDPPFHDPYLATSLQDFWGRRWNRVASASLRSTIFYPTYNFTHRLLGRQRAALLGLLLTFIVSEAMHEVLFYYMGRVQFAWGPPLFFLLHGLLVALESSLKRKIHVKWRLPPIISGPLIFGFAIYTFMRLVLPELLALNLDDKIQGEYAAFSAFVVDLGRTGMKWATNLL